MQQNHPEEEYPKKSANIAGVSAQAWGLLARPEAPKVAVPIRDAIEADKALGDPENSHCCPLCKDFFGTEAFKAHAQQCINLRAPRRRVWTPPGFSDNAVVSFKDKILPDFVVEAERIKAQRKKES